MKTAADSPVVQHSFIYFAWKVISTHLKLIKEGFCHAVQYAIVVQTTIFILLQLFHAFFLTKFLLLHSEKSIHALIMNNCTGAFKQKKKKQINKQKVFTYATNCTRKVLPLHKARTFSFLKLELALVNIPLLDAFALN